MAVLLTENSPAIKRKYNLNLIRLDRAERLLELVNRSGTLYSEAFKEDDNNASLDVRIAIRLLKSAIKIQRNYLWGDGE